MRQWFSLPVPLDWLKENQPNEIVIAWNGKPAFLEEGLGGLQIAGDFPPQHAGKFEGPLFQNNLAETSIYRFVAEDDWRLKGAMEYPGGKSSFYDGARWQPRRGAYRIRLLLQKKDGTSSIY